VELSQFVFSFLLTPVDYMAERPSPDLFFFLIAFG
jgi:hypothetical protein